MTDPVYLLEVSYYSSKRLKVNNMTTAHISENIVKLLFTIVKRRITARELSGKRKNGNRKISKLRNFADKTPQKSYKE